MLKNLTILVLVGISTISPATAKWQEVVVSASGSRVYVDQPVRRQGNTIWYWTWIRYSRPEFNGAIGAKSYESVICSTNKYQTWKSSEIDASGHIVESFDDSRSPETETVKAEPGTVAYSVIQKVCRK